jgi:ribonuclease Z
VAHCADAHALLLRGVAGWSLAFSGDCRPSAAFAALAAASTLLVHEATFEGALAAHAAAKRHCTVDEALAVAAAAVPAHTVLTHFSQRYPAAVPLPPGAAARTSIAFDGMRIDLGNLPDGVALTPLIEAALAEPDLEPKLEPEVDCNI